MAQTLNWFLQIRNLSKTDAKALELFEKLKKAETDEQKENAKKQAQEYIQALQSEEIRDKTVESSVVLETDVVDSGQNRQDVHESDDKTDTENAETDKQEKDKMLMDLSAPAFNPRLAKYGINREEELFLHGVFVRKMSHEDKILMRRAIYNKKTVAANKIQAEFKAKRIAQKEKDANDVEKQKFHRQRKLVSAIVDALEQHKNIGWIFNNVENLTIDVFKELIEKPGNVNAFNKVNPSFLENFKKKYGN